ncbi:MAG: NAD-dependent epimerase [Desulfuromusa sp.]|nr:NAD-dependent epimerase [Desulfuromusa sp.]
MQQESRTKQKVLVTGAAGFIGNALALSLTARGDEVFGIDNLNDYYEVSLKQSRLSRLEGESQFKFLQLDIADRKAVARLFAEHHFDAVVNLAAQTGVRYSLTNPSAYVDSNLVGFGNILEGCRHSGVKHLIFASSSSVYGSNTKLPFAETDNVDHPISLYAATKKAGELMAHSYAHLYNLPCTGLRFFTVYGPWGRPDMAYFSFTRKILAGEKIPVFNNGRMLRDFTYIEDIVDGIVRTMNFQPTGDENWNGNDPNPASSYAPYRVFNMGNNQSVELLRFIQVLENCIGKKAKMELLPMQDGDIPITLASTDELERAIGFKPRTIVETGLQQFVEWYRQYYKEI